MFGIIPLPPNKIGRGRNLKLAMGFPSFSYLCQSFIRPWLPFGGRLLSTSNLLLFLVTTKKRTANKYILCKLHYPVQLLDSPVRISLMSLISGKKGVFIPALLKLDAS